MELKNQCPTDNPRVIMLKEKIKSNFFDFLNSFEMNTWASNERWWNAMLDSDIKELDEAVESVYKANESKDNLKLSELQAERNKLNRQIATLKKANLKQ